MTLRHAPSGPVGHGQWPSSWLWICMARGLWLLAAASLLAWCVAPFEEGQAGLRWLMGLAAGTCLLWAWRLPFEAAPRLGFDPAHGWVLDEQPAPGAGHLAVCLDLGTAMLLRHRPGGSTGPRGSARWLALDQRARPLAWSELRRAVYSARIRSAPAEAAPQGASPRSPLTRTNERT